MNSWGEIIWTRIISRIILRKLRIRRRRFREKRCLKFQSKESDFHGFFSILQHYGDLSSKDLEILHIQGWVFSLLQKQNPLQQINLLINMFPVADTKEKSCGVCYSRLSVASSSSLPCANKCCTNRVCTRNCGSYWWCRRCLDEMETKSYKTNEVRKPLLESERISSQNETNEPRTSSWSCPCKALRNVFTLAIAAFGVKE